MREKQGLPPLKIKTIEDESAGDSNVPVIPKEETSLNPEEDVAGNTRRARKKFEDSKPNFDKAFKPLPLPFDLKDMKAEDFFKTDTEKFQAIQERKKDVTMSQCSLKDEDKTTLSDTQFMMCLQCNCKPIRVKESATGYLFASCEGFPRCKYAIFLPKCLKNIMVSDKECEQCAEA